ncbi:Thoeris anti-defense Tad2 family protein [Halobacillus karajensis]|uniref:Thoeris anti-defense 2-like domain-containing protein n=1 Tax=Halobacillus karajensis TaxID=195088 RepID=A0A059NWD1_9BACI|nr:hypothetical protein [Halobacillus karajensis]CDQ19288.1 hypothetical protein BN982_01574 [Halobacillus karajensis]CDQ22638.1 hypothetical protein BN983_00852 [Halobacillus karajensis]CDQ26120.1 hypothetical protein BN981_00332 [Halobacillus karajensis]
MNFMQAVKLLDEGHALERHTWKNSGYIVKDAKGKIIFFDHNEPTFYSLTTSDALAEDWEQVNKDQWTIVSVSHDRELMRGKLFVSYHICTANSGRHINNHLVDKDELSQWSRYVHLDLANSARYLNKQDVATIQNTIGA